MFIVTHDDQVALTLTTVGQFDGFRAITSPVVMDAIAESMESMYGKPIATAPRDGWVPSHYFAEDN